MNLLVQYQSVPLITVDVNNNIDLHGRAHGVPLRSRKSAVADLHYISNEIDDLAGGPHMVIFVQSGAPFHHGNQSLERDTQAFSGVTAPHPSDDASLCVFFWARRQTSRDFTGVCGACTPQQRFPLYYLHQPSNA
ncbi:hypothetical protein G5714_024650 [Onychostoma macrolepis]|uniref:NXPE C-terminal domain-containing protein n=1 Tax=Onychostoma macrolepis TaxID=369639 RepID=A0A7J6BK66_9TELE|nr:hypothetical protein G5714_024650 [Onychostoma macrolepis]